MAKNEAAEQAKRNSIAQGINYKAPEKSREKKAADVSTQGFPDIPEEAAAAETEVLQDKPVKKSSKENRSAAGSMRETYTRKFREGKRETRKISRIVYVTESLNEKVTKAVEKEEVKSFNDLVNYLLEAYFNE